MALFRLKYKYVVRKWKKHNERTGIPEAEFLAGVKSVHNGWPTLATPLGLVWMNDMQQAHRFATRKDAEMFESMLKLMRDTEWVQEPPARAAINEALGQFFFDVYAVAKDHKGVWQ